MDTTRGLKSTKAATSKLLPTHRFCTTIARHTLPFYAVPLHYLKRRGVISVLLCMGGIAFLHSAYLFPSTSNHFSDDMFYSSNSNIRDVKNSFFSLERIREQPSFGSAPINGIDENGFEIIEDPFAENIFMKDKVKEPSAHSKATILHEQEVQHGHSQPSRIQFKFEDSALHQTEERLDLLKARRTFVKGMIQHAWSGFLSKTMTPSSSDNQLVNRKNTRLFQIRTQWIDIMDTLLLTSMTEEYNFAKAKVLDTTKVISQNIHSWQQKSQVEKQASTRQQEQHQTQAHIQEQQSQENISEETNDTDQHGIGFYETVVRQLGGLLSICELERSQTPTNENLKLVNMAIDLGDLLALAFQGPNNALPASIIFESGRIGSNKILAGKVSLAEVSTFQLEFRQLSYLSSNIKYKELADNNINYLAALNLKVPGLYPAYFNPKYGVSHEYVASFGSLSDGFYEYLLKTYMLTENVKFKDLYIASIEAMYKHLISRSQKSSSPHLVLGVYDTATDILVPKMDHLSCFVPGLLALGSKVLNRPKDLITARGLMETCFMSYRNSATGLGADEIAFLGSEYSKGKEFEMLPRGSGFYLIDAEYTLRPETIESLFILYRITGDTKYQEYAWEIAQSIEKHCRTKDGYLGLINVMDASEGLTHSMPSYFLSQTLKYLYLIFEAPSVVSLDDYIFNTEGHIIKYPIS